MVINYKKYIPQDLINLYRFIKKNKLPQNISRLKSMPRFVEGKVTIQGKDLIYPDAASFYSTYIEIIKNESYRFNLDKSNPFIIDLGSNVGLSIIYFKSLYPNAKILAFEADPTIFRYLKENIGVFNFNNVEIINKAVYDSDSTLRFFSEGADGGRIEDTTGGNIIVESVDICKIIPGNSIIDLLKIDIEGSELAVLERCKDRLEFVNRIFIEYHSSPQIAPQKLSKLLGILEKSGYRYDIRHVNTIISPFIRPDAFDNGFDLQLEIYAWRQ